MVPCDTFVARAKGTCVSCDGGVAKAIPPYPAPPTTTSRRAKSDFRLMPFPFRTRLRGRERPQGHRAYTRSVRPTYVYSETVRRLRKDEHKRALPMQSARSLRAAPEATRGLWKG